MSSRYWQTKRCRQSLGTSRKFQTLAEGKIEVSVEPLGAEDEVLVVDEKIYFESYSDYGGSSYLAPCICQDYPPAGMAGVGCDEERGREKGCYILHIMNP